MREFRFLVGAPGRADADVLERALGRGDLAGKSVVRDEGAGRYLVFDSRDELWALEGGRHLHEVVFGWQPQRLKFDIDAPAAAVAALGGGDGAAIMRAVMDLLIDTILDVFHLVYFASDGAGATRGAVAVMDSSGETDKGYRFSYHILIHPFVVESNHEARAFTERLVRELPAGVAGLVDTGVNKSIQNFRLPGSSKVGSARVKRLCAAFPGTARGLSHDDLTVVPADAGAVRSLRPQHGAVLAAAPMPGGDHAAVAAALKFADARGVTAGFRHRKTVTEPATGAALVMFDRDAPTRCRICDEVHHHDNTLMLRVGTGGGETTVTELCRQARGRSIFHGAVPAAAGAAPAAAKRRWPAVLMARQITALTAKRRDPHNVTLFERLDDKFRHVYDEAQMRPYPRVGTLAVRAQMKIGKTRALRAFLSRHFPADGVRPSAVCFLTFRRTFTNNIKQLFPDFVSYRDHTGDLPFSRFPRLIIQAESLHRVPMPIAPERVGCLVLDEVESILSQFNSGLHHNFEANFALFQWLLRTAETVVVMDANVGDRTFRTLTRMRPDHPIHFHWNRFPRAADDVYFFTLRPEAWLAEMLRHLGGGDRIVVPINSLAEAETLETIIRAEFPRKRVQLYSSKTPPAEKARHFGDVATHWAQLDVLIYTPTVSAGVSFELPHFDRLYGFFTDRSCDVETCRQMMGRVRNIATHEHHICLMGTRGVFPTTPDDVVRTIHDRRARLYRASDGPPFVYDDDGNVHYFETPFFHLWVETRCVENKSRSGFVEVFVDQVADTGARVRELPVDADDEQQLAELVERRAGLKAIMRERRARRVAHAAVLQPGDIDRIRRCIDQDKDIADDDRLALERHRICELYGCHGLEMTTRFAQNFADIDVQRIFRNLTRLAPHPDILAALEAIRSEEASCFDVTVRADYGQWADPRRATAVACRDLARRYVFTRHQVAVWLLRACGFDCISDGEAVPLMRVKHGLEGVEQTIRASLGRLAAEYGIHFRPGLGRPTTETDPVRYVKEMVHGVVNPILGLMYGRALRRKEKQFRLVPTTKGRLVALGDTMEVTDTLVVIKSRLRPQRAQSEIVRALVRLVYSDE